MLLLQLTLLFVLVLGAGSIDYIYIYHRAGDEVIMPCNSVNSSETLCSSIEWLYHREIYTTDTIVSDGQINEDSPQADKLSLDHRCSLTITNISSKDAGRYICYRKTYEHYTNVYLNILTLSANQSTDPVGGVTLTCSLWGYAYIYCSKDSLKWLDEERDELKQDDDEVYYSGQKKCVSDLIITHQINHSRRYTCQFVKNNKVKISADYTLVSTAPNKIIFIIIIVASVGLLTILVIVGLTVFIKSRRKTGAAAEDAPKRARVPDGEESSVTYVNASYRK